jgi:1-pyrroline-5-carboxylate dehydrogenase
VNMHFDQHFPCLPLESYPLCAYTRKKNFNKGGKFMSGKNAFKLTYSTMFHPPEEFHHDYEKALQQVLAKLGKEHAMLINGRDVLSPQKFEDRSPANTGLVLGLFQSGTIQDAGNAVDAARAAFPAWSHLKWERRVELIRSAANALEKRMFEIGAVLSLEVGKNRLEAMADVAETIDLIRYACDRMEANDGFIAPMAEDPLPGYQSTNISLLRPYGVWLVISPFNFPASLCGGPAAAALVTGNTVVLKPASDTPWTSRIICECLREAGLPDGVYNYVTGAGGSLGQALVDDPDIGGLTFTGSFDVGMGIYKRFGRGKWVRPIILEMGGKNAAIVTRHADIDTAVMGITRSAFGLQGQKCSADSRVFIEESVYDEVIANLVEATEKMVIGDPTERSVYLGPVINARSYESYANYVEEIRRMGHILTGGKHLTEGGMGKGYYCAPTLAELPLDHPLWCQEMFLPITTVAKIKSLEEGIELANQVDYGLTAGLYGDDAEKELFQERIEAGVAYANRPQGATTGAWPGYQPFGGWKASGASGKNSGGLYYLQLYMHEQIRNSVSVLK